MSAELSSVITGLQKVGASVVQSGKAHYRKVGVVLGARVAPVLPDGQPMPDFEALQLGLVSLVQSELDKTLAHELEAKGYSWIAEQTATAKAVAG